MFKRIAVILGIFLAYLQIINNIIDISKKMNNRVDSTVVCLIILYN